MLPLTLKDIRTEFRSASMAELGLPALQNIDWAVLDYFGWIHPSGSSAFVIMPVEEEFSTLRLGRIVSNSGRPRTRMCSWCHHVYRSRGTALFRTTVRGSDGRRSIGNHICRNLDCSLRIRNLTSDPPTYLPETLHIQRKISRLQTSVLTFMSRAKVLPES